MTLWFFNRVYHPNRQATATLLTDLCRRLDGSLAARVVCDVPGEAQDGATAVERPARGAGSDKRLLGKAWGYLRYFGFAFSRARKMQAGDLAVIWTDPPMLDVLLGLYCRVRGVRYVPVLQDVYPQVLTAAGMLRSDGLVAGLLRRLQRHAHAGAAAVVCISDDTRRRLGLAGAQVIANWSVEAPAAPEPAPVGGRVVVTYSGNLGYAFDVEGLERALEILPERERFTVIIRGEGRKRAAAERLARRFPEVQVLGPLPQAEYVRRRGESDAQLILTPQDFFGVVYASKLYSILAAGMPVLASLPAGSEMADFVRARGVGLVATAGKPEELAARFSELAALKAAGKLADMRTASLAAARERDGAAAAREYEELFKRLTC
jgi:hypothetical protein